MRDIRPIKTETDYDWALQQIAPYFEREPHCGTPEADRFDVLAALIAEYEAKTWPIDVPDPVEAILSAMELGGKTQADLASLLGSRSRASEILSRRRALTLRQAWLLHQEWAIPAALLLRPYRLAA